MDKLQIYGDFFYCGKEYSIRHFTETDYDDDEVMTFQFKENLRAFLLNMFNDRSGGAWPFLNTIARNSGLGTCKTDPKECERENLDFLSEKIYSGEWVLIKRRFMTKEDREKLAEIYKIYTGGVETEPSRWNEKAAKLLAKMVENVEVCSRGMGLIKALLPQPTKITWVYLVNVGYNIIVNEIKINKGFVNTYCCIMGVEGYKTSIENALT